MQKQSITGFSIVLVAIFLLTAVISVGVFFKQSKSFIKKDFDAVTGAGYSFEASSESKVSEKKDSFTQQTNHCALLSVSFEEKVVREGEPAKILVESFGCPSGELVELELWESDGPNGSEIVSDVKIENMILTENTGWLKWKAVWIKDFGDPLDWLLKTSRDYLSQSDPEYFVKATLKSSKEQAVFTENNLTVQSSLTYLILE